MRQRARRTLRSRCAPCSSTRLVPPSGRGASSSATRARRSATRARASPHSTDTRQSPSPRNVCQQVAGTSPATAAAARRMVTASTSAATEPDPSADDPPGRCSGKRGASGMPSPPSRGSRRVSRPADGASGRRDACRPPRGAGATRYSAAGSSPTAASRRPRSPARSCRALKASRLLDSSRASMRCILVAKSRPRLPG